MSLLGLLTPLVLVAGITLLHLVLPGRWYDGYVTAPGTDRLLRYRLNGVLVLVVSVLAWAGLGAAGLVPWDWLYTVRWEALTGAFVFGLLFSITIVVLAPSTGKPFPVDLFLGRLENPQLWGGRLDAKMWLYLFGAVVLELNALSFTAHHVMTQSPVNPGVLLCCAMITWFVCDYLVFERVHLYTYDIFAERVGFKLGWGCLTFYPFFYPIALWSTAALPAPGWPTPALLVPIVLFLGGWSLARGANMQKFAFKRDPRQPFLGIVPEALTDGDRALLVNGFWGVSRHVNYLGEIGMALGIATAVGYPLLPWPWLYPLYYVLLLVPRQIDDDARCAAKYGPLWQRYLERVPYRIVPGVY